VAPQIVNGSSDPKTDQPLCSSVGPKLSLTVPHFLPLILDPTTGAVVGRK
jgi:hypothetical protein